MNGLRQRIQGGGPEQVPRERHVDARGVLEPRGVPVRGDALGLRARGGAGLLRPPALAVPGRCEGRRAWEPYPLGTKREAMRLLAGGMEPRFVAGRLGIASAAPVRLWASRLGRLDGLDGQSRPDGERERGEAVTMFARGSSVSEIAGRIGADRRTVRRWLDKAGVERKRATKGKGGEGVAKEEGGERGEWSPRMGRPPRRRPRRAGAAGRGQARGGAGGVGRPKSTRPGLFEQFGEAPGGREGEGDGGEGEGR